MTIRDETDKPPSETAVSCMQSRGLNPSAVAVEAFMNNSGYGVTVSRRPS
jgi:hypothetical protein